MENNSVKEGKTTAIISYITILGSIIAIFMNMEPKNPFAGFHIRQAFGINITFYVLGYFVGNFDSWMVSGAFYIFFSVLWIYGLIGAIQGEMKVIPLLGEYFQKWFKNLA
ncbi:hypothetical protein FEDK69T_00770 [Flavobacterium enshiense DK69]|uniref:Membrane protein n=1 Tax=Flavobacterium enshiense DK69 TaxID=1107311 RepID=V6SEV0_9FLAO|nr:hypothetical protein [Flavobacterium enshiense]ESU25111.1 hypothetical protein FEDK69T_00770 [Flavobacterium enshiense DK69]KGO96993.1 membrane protein [Flavobacterium enshiense DK69]